MKRVSEGEARRRFIETLLAHTVRLVRNAATFPLHSGAASGFLLPNGADFRLITAGHQFDRPGPWTMETSASGPDGTLHVALRNVQRLARLDSDNEESGPIDLAWADIKRADIKKGLAARSDRSASIRIYKGPLKTVPMESVGYGFATYTQAEFDANLGVLRRSPCYELEMQLKERDPATGVITFSLARAHQGDDYYEGSSGAPIADPTGRIIAVVLGGSQSENVLHGIALSRYASLFAPGELRH